MPGGRSAILATVQEGGTACGVPPCHVLAYAFAAMGPGGWLGGRGSRAEGGAPTTQPCCGQLSHASV